MIDYSIIIVVFLLILIVILVTVKICRARFRKQKLEEEINKLNQYVNSAGDKRDQSKLGTHPQILSQSNSFSKKDRMFQIQETKPARTFLEFEKSEREAIVQEQSSPQQIKPGFTKKKLNIEIPEE
ncbi:hypothetical protein pb186bvf_017608 [Paramecium bursaria]